MCSCCFFLTPSVLISFRRWYLYRWNIKISKWFERSFRYHATYILQQMLQNSLATRSGSYPNFFLYIIEKQYHAWSPVVAGPQLAISIVPIATVFGAFLCLTQLVNCQFSKCMITWRKFNKKINTYHPYKYLNFQFDFVPCFNIRASLNPVSGTLALTLNNTAIHLFSVTA